MSDMGADTAPMKDPDLYAVQDTDLFYDLDNDPEIVITSAEPYRMPTERIREQNDGLAIGASRHDALTEHLRADITAALPDNVLTITENELAVRPRAAAVYDLLASYGADPALFAAEDLARLYETRETAADTLTEPFADHTVVLENASYYPPDQRMRDDDPLNAAGELDVAILDTTEEPWITVIEAKSDGEAAYPNVKDQVGRFADYADALGWTTTLRLGLYDQASNHILHCEYVPRDPVDPDHRNFEI